MIALRSRMQPILARLAHVETRVSALQELAQLVGAREALLLVKDVEIDVLLPAPGLPKSLPNGAGWRDFLRRCHTPGIARAEMPGSAGKSAEPAIAWSGSGLSVILVGGTVAAPALSEIEDALPLLAAALISQQQHAVARGDLAACRNEMREALALTRKLDEARAEIERTLSELDAQTASLEEARQRAESATRAKDEFMAMLGHELRNPLSPIVTALEILRLRTGHSAEHEIIKRQLDHMVRLVDDLLDVSRIAQGKLSLSKQVFDLAGAVDAALEMAKPLIEHKAQRVALCAAGEPLHVDGDPARLAQVFSNLLTNASKYSDRGACIEVTSRRVGESVEVRVRDPGMGIEPAMLDRVFDLFEQQGRIIDRARGGLGLGLAIVRNLVELHGGSVHAESPGAGQGSQFVVVLPLVTALRAGVVPAPALPDHTAAEHKRILLVDDNVDALNMLALALSQQGHEVETAADAEDALRRAGEFQAEVAILDIGLPRMDGYALAGQLRRLPGWEETRFIALTGYGQPSDRARSSAAGFHQHVVKPVDLDCLRGLLAGASTVSSR